MAMSFFILMMKKYRHEVTCCFIGSGDHCFSTTGAKGHQGRVTVKDQAWIVLCRKRHVTRSRRQTHPIDHAIVSES
jgi:hypothetical protein